MHVVVVESPAKAKTINKYLGRDYEVLASFGHVRDLPSKDGSVRPDEDFAMTYQVEDDSKKHIAAIAKAVKGADTLYLATDPDREGEAISWHVLEALKESKSLKNVEIKRIVFHEITKKAVLDAIAHPRDIDMNLVNAQQARRALDYLVGFTLSPVLWRKLPGSKSAGRVQSVAVRLICERDAEIAKFISQEYWNIHAELLTAAGQNIRARLTHWMGERLEKFSIPNEDSAKKITAALTGKNFTVSAIEPRQVRRHPQPPFTTSTLQQEASRKLGFGAKKTMQLAQKLYEGVAVGGENTGLITYMRTDSVSVSQDAVNAARSLITKRFGAAYVPAAPRAYKVKSKNAQEAHEAVRPTDLSRTPESVRAGLDNDMYRLYDLIWKRMLASQMESALYDQVAVDFVTADKNAQLRANGSVVKFDGFMALYQEGVDDADGDDESQRPLPELKPNEKLDAKSITPEQHFTEPPPRYSEASLVKKLEELGIGRPSTYASIISVIQDRGYVRQEKKRFIGEPLGQLVSAFLTSFFDRYVEYDFTAQLEDRLDDVAGGEYPWKQLLRDFWNDFSARIEEGKQLKSADVLTALENLLAPFIFKSEAEGGRSCPTCKDGTLGLKLGRYGAFLGCSRYPDCNYTKPLAALSAPGSDDENAGPTMDGEFPRALGNHPVSGEPISLRKGPYGLYVQEGDGKTPKRASIPKSTSPDALTLEYAVSLLQLPRDIGTHPDTGKMITAGQGRFGPYLLHNGKYTSLKGDDDPVTIGINRAVALINDAASGARAGATPLRTLGDHPDGGSVEVYAGRYGPYVKHGKINATLTKGLTPESVTLEDALPLLAAKADAPAAGKKKPFKKAAGNAANRTGSAAKTTKKPAAKAATKPKKAAAKK